MAWKLVFTRQSWLVKLARRQYKRGWRVGGQWLCYPLEQVEFGTTGGRLIMKSQENMPIGVQFSGTGSQSIQRGWGKWPWRVLFQVQYCMWRVTLKRKSSLILSLVSYGAYERLLYEEMVVWFFLGKGVKPSSNHKQKSKGLVIIKSGVAMTATESLCRSIVSSCLYHFPPHLCTSLYHVESLWIKCLIFWWTALIWTGILSKM